MKRLIVALLILASVEPAHAEEHGGRFQSRHLAPNRVRSVTFDAILRRNHEKPAKTLGEPDAEDKPKICPVNVSGKEFPIPKAEGKRSLSIKAWQVGKQEIPEEECDMGVGLAWNGVEPTVVFGRTYFFFQNGDDGEKTAFDEVKETLVKDGKTFGSGDSMEDLLAFANHPDNEGRCIEVIAHGTERGLIMSQSVDDGTTYLNQDHPSFEKFSQIKNSLEFHSCNAGGDALIPGSDGYVSNPESFGVQVAQVKKEGTVGVYSHWVNPDKNDPNECEDTLYFRISDSHKTNDHYQLSVADSRQMMEVQEKMVADLRVKIQDEVQTIKKVVGDTQNLVLKGEKSWFAKAAENPSTPIELTIEARAMGKPTITLGDGYLLNEKDPLLKHLVDSLEEIGVKRATNMKVRLVFRPDEIFQAGQSAPNAATIRTNLMGRVFDAWSAYNDQIAQRIMAHGNQRPEYLKVAFRDPPTDLTVEFKRNANGELGVEVIDNRIIKRVGRGPKILDWTGKMTDPFEAREWKVSESRDAALQSMALPTAP